MKKLAPSILSADFSALAEDVAKTERGGADLIHVDVMDGHFVPNISFGAYVMKCLNGKANIPYDVHLMITDPDKYAAEFVTDTTEYITIHQEACVHLERSVKYLKSLGVKAGVALNPATPLSTLEYVLGDVDMVLLMSVNPGFGGQKFIPSALGKLAQLAEMRAKGGYEFEIEMDGGITTENVGKIAEAGCDIIVAGSAVFKAPDITERTKEFISIIR